MVGGCVVKEKLEWLVGWCGYTHACTHVCIHVCMPACLIYRGAIDGGGGLQILDQHTCGQLSRMCPHLPAYLLTDRPYPTYIHTHIPAQQW